MNSMASGDFSKLKNTFWSKMAVARLYSYVVDCVRITANSEVTFGPGRLWEV